MKGSMPSRDKIPQRPGTRNYFSTYKCSALLDGTHNRKLWERWGPEIYDSSPVYDE